MIPALGFMPDADPTTPGVFIDCHNIVPTIKGFAAGPSMADAGFPALASDCRGAALVRLINNSRRLFAGTDVGLYENINSLWADVSRAGGYSPGAENRWRFTQMGNAIIAANQQDVLQFSISGAFADIAGAPKARIVETVAGFVFAFATDDPLNGDEPDRWWCSALYDYSDWTPDIATQCANGRFIDTPGEVRAARSLGNNIVAYKEKSMFLGSYMGPPVIWAWQQVPGEIGAFSQETVVNIDTAHLFIGNGDFWLFDGSRPVSIGAPVRDWFFSTVNQSYMYRTQGYFDRTRALVYWYFVSNSSEGVLDECLLYNIKTQKWGRATRSIQAVVNYVAPGLTFETIGDVYATFDDIQNVSYDSPQWFSDGDTVAVFDSSNKLMLLTGDAAPCSVTVNDSGDDSQYSTITRVRCRFLKTPESGTLAHFHKAVEGDPLLVGANATLDDGKFDLLYSARWHRVEMSFTGQMEMNGFDVELKPDGLR